MVIQKLYKSFKKCPVYRNALITIQRNVKNFCKLADWPWLKVWGNVRQIIPMNREKTKMAELEATNRELTEKLEKLEERNTELEEIQEEVEEELEMVSWNKTIHVCLYI